MRRWMWPLIGVGALAVAAPLAFLADTAPAPAADHLDPPTRTDGNAGPARPDIPADIADVYAWHTADNVVIAMTFAGPRPGSFAASYDRDVLYTFNVANGFPRTTPTYQIQVRFGQDLSKGANQFGMRVTGLPGNTVIEGPVETVLTANGIKAFAGLVDDPFTFDLLGFRATRTAGTLNFSNSRDFFFRQNDSAIILEIPRQMLQNGTQPLDIWATAARFGGLL